MPNNFPQPLRLLIVIEANAITGPVKNLLGFCQWLISPEGQALPRPISPVLVTYRRPGGPVVNPFAAAVEKLGLPFHFLDESGPYDLSLLQRLPALAASVAPDILQSHNVKTNFLIKASGLHQRYPWISFQHGYTATDLKMLAYNQLDRWSLRSATRVVTVCQAFAPRLRDYGVAADRIAVLHNSVGPFTAAPAVELDQINQQFGLAPTELLLFTAGRLSREKGHADLLHALAQLKASIPTGWRCAIAGEGPEMQPLEQLRARLGLEQHVLLPGYQANTRAWFSRADIFVLPSHSEGSPNVILEAMAAEVPIAATRAGGTPEIITHEQDALLSPVSDPAALATNLARLVADPALRTRLTAAALHTAQSRFSPQQYRRNILSIYQHLLPSC